MCIKYILKIYICNRDTSIVNVSFSVTSYCALAEVCSSHDEYELSYAHLPSFLAFPSTILYPPPATELLHGMLIFPPMFFCKRLKKKFLPPLFLVHLTNPKYVLILRTKVISLKNYVILSSPRQKIKYAFIYAHYNVLYCTYLLKSSSVL